MQVFRALLPALLLLATAAAPAPEAAAPALSDIALLNRVTWGATPTEVARFRAMGRERWLAWQLHPTEADRLPP